MDVNVTLARIDDILRRGESGDEVDELCEAIYDWLAKGGFEPSWNKHPLATSYYKCRKLAIERGERLE